MVFASSTSPPSWGTRRSEGGARRPNFTLAVDMNKQLKLVIRTDALKVRFWVVRGEA